MVSRLMPREASFFEMFAEPSKTIVAAAHALDQLLTGMTLSKGALPEQEARRTGGYGLAGHAVS